MRIIQKVQLHYYAPSMDSLTLPQGLLAGVSCWLSCLVMIDIVMTTWHHPHASTLKTLYKYSCEIVQISTICHPSSVLSGPKLSDLQISCCWAPENVVTPSTEMRRYLYTWPVSGSSARPPHPLLNIRIFPAPVWAAPLLRCRERTGKQRENERWVHRLSGAILYTSVLITASVTSVS